MGCKSPLLLRRNKWHSFTSRWRRNKQVWILVFFLKQLGRKWKISPPKFFISQFICIFTPIIFCLNVIFSTFSQFYKNPIFRQFQQPLGPIVPRLSQDHRRTSLWYINLFLTCVFKFNFTFNAHKSKSAQAFVTKLSANVRTLNLSFATQSLAAFIPLDLHWLNLRQHT